MGHPSRMLVRVCRVLLNNGPCLRGAGAAWAWLYYILAFELNSSVIQWLTLQESQAADYNKNKLYGAWIYAGLSSIAFIVFCFNQSWAHLALPSFVNIYR